MSPDALRTLLRGSLTGESHPGRTLTSHLEGVCELSVGLGRAHGVIDEAEEALLSYMALTHDLAKERPAWQKYLRGKGPQVNHSKDSSLFAFDATGDVMAAELVRSHHGRFPDINDAISAFWANDQFKPADALQIMNEILPDWNPRLTEDAWDNLIDTMLFDSPPFNEKAWLKARKLFSLFITADRMNALGVRHFELPPLPAFKRPAAFKETPLNDWRSEARKDCIEIAKQSGSPGIYTLTLPTGAGKTYIGLEIASLWAEKHGYNSITYVLPFISIVEQNSEVAGSLFGADSVQEDHSLAILSKTDEPGTESASPAERMQTLFRYWRLPVVVTTLAHFWDSLYGAKANHTMNFHRLGKSIIILDEPQSVSADLWPGLGNTLELLSHRTGAAFLLMTATQPHIASGKSLEIAPEKHRKPPDNRRTYKILPGKHSLPSFPELLKTHIPLNETSGLIVANTRMEALEMHRMLCSMKEKCGGSPLKDAPVLFLSTWLTPAHRRKTLGELRRLEKEDKPRFLVSTQVVEAGVDLDFRWAVRDYGPFDSIIQVGGRCNRHGGESHGTVLVANFVNDKGRSFASMVYSSALLNAMNEIASERAEFNENEISPLIDRYYTLVTSSIKGSGLWQKITDGSWTDLPPLYDGPETGTIALIIEREGLKEVINQLFDEKWTLERLETRKALLNILQQHTIEIPLRALIGCREALSARFLKEGCGIEQLGDTNMWLLSEEATDMIYHPVTGFIPPSKQGDDIDGLFT